jgi:hypothetical protein
MKNNKFATKLGNALGLVLVVFVMVMFIAVCVKLLTLMFA